MPRYYFHVDNGSDVAIDEDGTELPDLDTAKQEAIEDHLAFAITALKSRKPLPAKYSINICDGRGMPLASVHFAEAIASLTVAV